MTSTTEKHLVALARKPKAAGALFHLAQLAMCRGSLDFAEAMLRRAVKEEPSDAELWNNLGVVLARTGRSDEAGDAFATAVGLRSDYQDAAANLEQIARGCFGNWKVTRTRLTKHRTRLASAA
jgi:Flp pilus assembly protein TadD